MNVRPLPAAALALALAAPSLPAWAAKPGAGGPGSSGRAAEPGHSEEIPPPFDGSTQRITEKGRIHSIESGPEDGPKVVLVHGFPDAAAEWIPVVEALDDVYRVYAVDLAGCGYSGRPDFLDYSVAALADYLLSFFDAADIPRAHLVGLDLGHLVALRFAASHPRRVDHLVVGSGPVTPGQPLPGMLARLDASISGELEVARVGRNLGDYLKEGMAGAPDPGAARVASMAAPFEGKGAKKALLQWIRSVPPELYRLGERTAPLAEVTSLVVWGQQDPYYPPSTAEALRALLPGSKLRMLEGVGHFPVLEKPAALAEALMEFLPRPEVEPFVAEVPLAGHQGERLTATFRVRNDRKRRVKLALSASPFERVGQPVVLPGRKPVEPAGPEGLVLSADKLTVEPGQEAEVSLELPLDPRRFQFGERYRVDVALASDVKGLEVPPVLIGVKVLRLEEERPAPLYGDPEVPQVVRVIADPPPPEPVKK